VYVLLTCHFTLCYNPETEITVAGEGEMTMKARDKGPRPPYVTYATWVRVLEDVKERKPTQLDGSYFRDLGLSDSTGVTVKAALWFLGLIEGEGMPTENLLELVGSEGDDRRRVIKQILDEAYGPIVGGVDLEHATMGHLLDSFRRFGAEGNVGHKCVTFFLALAKDAGMTLSPNLLTKSRVGAPQRREIGAVGGSRGVSNVQRSRSPRKSVGAGPSHLASKLPAFDPSWPKEVRDEWLAHHRTLQTTMALMEKFPSLNAEWSDEVKAKWFDCWKEILNRNLVPPTTD
jgi:hypothetical protein